VASAPDRGLVSDRIEPGSAASIAAIGMALSVYAVAIERGFPWDSGYSEAMILYVLALGSPTFPVPASSYLDWTRPLDRETVYGIDYLYAGPLFVHQSPEPRRRRRSPPRGLPRRVAGALTGGGTLVARGP
jgi:hypothetical protein